MRTFGGFIALGLIAVALTVYARNPAHRYSGEGFLAFACAGAAVAGHHDPYVIEPLRTCEHRADPRFFSSTRYAQQWVEPAPLPPYALAGFGLLAAMPFAAAETVWYVTLFLAVWAAALLAWRVTGVHPVIACFALCVPAATNIYYGELVPLVVAGILLCAFGLLRARRLLACAGAVITLIEPHVGLPLFLALLIGDRSLRALLILSALALAALSLLASGFEVNLQYFTRTLPLHARAEIGAIDQYSLTWVAHVIGMPDDAALVVGSVCYTAVLVAGVAAGLFLSRHHRAPAFLALTPPAFAVIGGAFVHDLQLMAAVPLAFGMTTLRPRSFWPWIAIVLLSIPGSWLWWSKPLLALWVLSSSVVSIWPLSRRFAGSRLWAAIVLICTGFACLAIVMHHFASVSPASHAALPNLPSDASASVMWAASLLPWPHVEIALALSKCAGWAGLAILASMAVRAAGRRDRAPVP
jgi:hypothetical protein